MPVAIDLSEEGGVMHTTVNTFNMTDPGSVDADDIVVCAIVIPATATITTVPSGWSAVGSSASITSGTTESDARLATYWARGEPTWTGWGISLSRRPVWSLSVISGCKTSGNPWTEIGDYTAKPTTLPITVPFAAVTVATTDHAILGSFATRQNNASVSASTDGSWSGIEDYCGTISVYSQVWQGFYIPGVSGSVTPPNVVMSGASPTTSYIASRAIVLEPEATAARPTVKFVTVGGILGGSTILGPINHWG